MVTGSDRVPPAGQQPDPLAAFPRSPVHGGDRPDQQAPSVEQAIALREQAPELYDLWLKIAQEKAATANYVDRAPYEVPERLAQSGRPRALGALIVVLSFCGYLAWLGGPGPYIGGLIAILDLIAMLAVLFALRPDRLAEPGRAERRRRLGARRGITRRFLARRHPCDQRRLASMSRSPTGYRATPPYRSPGWFRSPGRRTTLL
jgi:hypothetical protein